MLHPTGLIPQAPLALGMTRERGCPQALRALLALWLLCPSELPRGNLTVLIPLQDREQQAPLGEGACESRVEARAGTPWRTPLNTLPNRNPGRQQVSPTHCCQRANTIPRPCPWHPSRQTQGRACSGWQHIPIREQRSWACLSCSTQSHKHQTALCLCEMGLPSKTSALGLAWTRVSLSLTV